MGLVGNGEEAAGGRGREEWQKKNGRDGREHGEVGPEIMSVSGSGVEEKKDSEDQVDSTGKRSEQGMKGM